MIAGIHTTKPRTQRYVDAFVNGTPGPYKVYQFRDLNELPPETLTMYGILAGSGEIYKWCKQENRDFYFMDHGYFTNAHDSPHWLRITKNEHCIKKLLKVSDDRFRKYFNIELKPWNKNGKDILVLPPTNAIAGFFNATDWLENTVTLLKQHTDRNIVIREKPYNPTIAVDHVGATVKVDKPTDKSSGKIDWSDIFACVTYNSNTMIESFANGVPVFCDPTASAALPIAETNFTKIENPKYEERELLFHSLAYANFNLTELQDGTAWRILNEKTDYYTK